MKYMYVFHIGSHLVLVHLGCNSKIPQTGWLIDTRNLLRISVSGWKSEMRVPASLS